MKGKRKSPDLLYMSDSTSLLSALDASQIIKIKKRKKERIVINLCKTKSILCLILIFFLERFDVSTSKIKYCRWVLVTHLLTGGGAFLSGPLPLVSCLATVSFPHGLLSPAPAFLLLNMS